jgi:hypothetical protein
MLFIIYNKATKHVVVARVDSSTPAPAPLATHLAYFADDHNVNPQDYAIVELQNKKLGDVKTGKHMWNETTQQLDEDPSYVEPPPDLTLAEPTPTPPTP